MFLFEAGQMRAHFEEFQPEIWNRTSEAFDTAIMENISAVSHVPAAFFWSDVGSWKSLYEASEKDADGNAIKGDVVIDDC